MPLPKTMPKGRKPSKDEGRVYANRYRVLRRLGSGNFGTVFLVEDMKANGEQKCLKEIYVGELHPDETVDAMREANLLSKLNHPNIVKFMDSFLDREFFCIVTEYCEGGDLGEKIHAWQKAGKTFDESLIIAWFIQIVLAVQFMHSKRVLHRDLKTRNIFLKNNMIKLGDFGISRILMGTSDMATTFTGTPYYMSPEVLKHEAYNHKSDMWSLGAILYEMCNLEHPFQGQSLMGIMYKIVEGDPPKLSERYSSELQKLYEKLLAKDPSVRPSGSEITRNEFIASNMKKLRLQMQDKLNSSVKGSFHSTGTHNTTSTQRPVTRSGRNGGSKLYEEPSERPMTPLDKMKLRKIQKADEEAEKIKRFMASQGNEAQEQCMSHKKKQTRVSLPWVDEHPEVFEDPHFTLNKKNSVEDRRQFSFQREKLPKQTNGNNRTWGTNEGDNTFDLTMVSDIPEDAALAETYYSQFEDEFEASDSDSEACDNEETFKHFNDDEDDDYSALVDQMENALEYSISDLDTSLSDEIMGQGLSTTLRKQRMITLRKECIQVLGQEEFNKVYAFLKDARFGEEFQNEESIMAGLGKIVKNPRDCFLVDQLLFMEKQAEIAAMT